MGFFKELGYIISILIIAFMSIIGLMGLLFVASPFIIGCGIYIFIKDIVEVYKHNKSVKDTKF